jgi:predicted acyltransferase
MHTEHLQNVRYGWVIAGWLVAIAVTSLVVFMFEASGFVGETGARDNIASLVSVLAGFMAGGFFAGFRARRAPVLHGIGIGLTSLVAWVLVNLIASALLDTVGWSALTPGVAVGLVLMQVVAAIVGALLGYNLVTEGKPGLSEHGPTD